MSEIRFISEKGPEEKAWVRGEDIHQDFEGIFIGLEVGHAGGIVCSEIRTEKEVNEGLIRLIATEAVLEAEKTRKTDEDTIPLITEDGDRILIYSGGDPYVLEQKHISGNWEINDIEKIKEELSKPFHQITNSKIFPYVAMGIGFIMAGFGGLIFVMLVLLFNEYKNPKNNRNLQELYNYEMIMKDRIFEHEQRIEAILKDI